MDLCNAAASNKRHDGLLRAPLPPSLPPSSTSMSHRGGLPNPSSVSFPVRKPVAPLLHQDASARKEFQCQVCGYKAISESKLTIHFRTHTGEKPFVCPYCSHRCAHKSNLITHVKSRHAGQLQNKTGTGVHN